VEKARPGGRAFLLVVKKFRPFEGEQAPLIERQLLGQFDNFRSNRDFSGA
jgi:hypothetical protein